MPYIMLAVSLIAIMVHLFLTKDRNAKKVVEVTLLYLLVICFGIGTMMSGAFHVFDGPETAKMIGWPPGSPFQYELGVADMALGLTCFLCLFIRGSFWLAAIIAQSVFLFGCMIGHVRDMLLSGNTAAYNIGAPIIVADLVIPLLVISLYIALRRLDKN